MEEKIKIINIILKSFTKRQKIIEKLKSNYILLVNVTIIIFILILLFFYLYKKNKKKLFYNDPIIDTIMRTYKYNLKKEEIKPYIQYIEYSKKDITLNKYISPLHPIIPKISIIISMHNRGEYIKWAIRSIQNQDFIDFEIIVVDDCSSDNSTKYVKQLQNEDNRIILLQNKENMGTLYTKSIGVLYAKGKYIQSLDSDDMLCNRNYLSKSYNLTIKGDYDFIASNGLYINNIHKYIIIREPFYVVIWAKLIKKEIYLDSIYQVGIDILKLKVIALDDNIIAFMFRNKKGIKLNDVGIAHFIHKSQHVYFNRFKNKKNTKIFCKNIIKTIKAFFMFKDDLNIRRGKFFLDNMFINSNGKCSNFSNQQEIQQLVKNETNI